MILLDELFPYAHIIFRVLSIIYVLSILTCIGVVISENRNPVKSLAWITVLILLPVAGFVLYLFFGRSLKSVRMISHRKRRRLRNTDRLPEASGAQPTLNEANRSLSSLASRLVDCPVIPGNEVDIFTRGKEKMEALEADLEAAREYIHLQYYIIEDDMLGNRLAEILVRKAQEGVKLTSRYFKRLRKQGVEAYPFLKVTFPELANHANWRNHRKVVVIDGEVGYIGGMNIADRYVDGTRKGPWRDTHLRIRGNAVRALQYSFAVDWYFMRHELLDVPLKDYDPSVPGDVMQLVMSGPTDRWSNIGFIFLRALSSAKKCVYVQTPYFLPNDSLLRTLQSVALSGVDVRLMMPRNPDSRLLEFAAHSYIKECLLSGIKVYFYEEGMLHSKVIIVDDEFVTTGSTNFDFRSFEHNFECNVLVYGTDFNRRMKAIFDDDQQHCTRIILANWKKRSLWRKAVESVARLMAPIL